MKKLNVLLIVLLGTLSLQSQNHTAPDTIYQNTVWDYDTVFLINSVYIPDNVGLTINPGITIIANGYYKINVKGNINANGTKDEMIKFTVSDTIGFSDSSSIVGGWDGFIFNGTSISNDSSVFDYCILEYGKNIEDTSKGGVLYDYNFSKIRISNCIIQHNYSYRKGGALYFENASPKIYNNEFYYNKTYWEGAGIYLKGETTSVIHHNLFKYNSAFQLFDTPWGIGAAGGGSAITVGYGDLYTNKNATIIYNQCFNNETVSGTIYESTYSAKIINNVICNNFGDGIFNGHGLGHAVIMNNTVCNNYTPFGGINIDSGALKVINNIVWGNSFWYEVPQIDVDGGIRPTIEYNCIEGGYDGIGNIDTLPGFVNPSPASTLDTIYEGDQYNWTLLENSPCINRGLTDTIHYYIPQYDLAGNPRINNLGIDIGAYEYQIPANIISAIYEENVTLFPNPGKDIIKIRFTANLNVTGFELYDIYGKLMIKEEISSNFESYNISFLKQGLYFYRIYNKNKLIAKGKWVKQ